MDQIQSDILLIGGGIVGLSTAYQISQLLPGRSICVVEKEPEIASHQTGHNSGVLHSGIYYQPGSLKAINCRSGKLAMQAFCQQHDIRFELCGKVIVATSENELPALERIYQRGQANGVTCRVIERSELLELEPHAAGIKAIHVPEAGIVDYRQVCQKLVELIQQQGHQVFTNWRVTKIEHRATDSWVSSHHQSIATKLIVNCGGLHADRLMKLGGSRPEAKIVPFRGEYYYLNPEKQHLCRNLIYPVPDPNFPFLGVHFTRMIGGGVECGPNAVLAFAREGYTKTKLNLGDLCETMTYPGFLKLAIKHWKMGTGEMYRSFSKQAFVKALQRLMPEITAADLQPAEAGVRAQAVLPNGGLVDDFLIVEKERMVHVNNAPSPAATASLNIGLTIAQTVARKAAQRFE